MPLPASPLSASRDAMTNLRVKRSSGWSPARSRASRITLSRAFLVAGDSRAHSRTRAVEMPEPREGVFVGLAPAAAINGRVFDRSAVFAHELWRAVGGAQANARPFADANHPDHAPVARSFMIEIGESCARHGAIKTRTAILSKVGARRGRTLLSYGGLRREPNGVPHLGDLLDVSPSQSVAWGAGRIRHQRLISRLLASGNDFLRENRLLAIPIRSLLRLLRRLGD